jgi:hypothetical protein
MRFGPPFDYARRCDGRRVAYQVVGGGRSDRGGAAPVFEDEMDDIRAVLAAEAIPDDWQLYAVELAAA